MTHIAFLGAGLLGSAFVEAALRRGEPVTVWNRTPSRALALGGLGARVAASPADAVRGAARVHLVLSDDAVVDDVIAQAREALAPDTVIVDHSTTLPSLTAERSRRLNGEGVRYLHCPVFIGPVAARAGQGTILASGPRALFDAVQPALSLQAARVEYLGERPDLAAVHKLCGNALMIGINAVIADVLTLAGTVGVSTDDAMGIIGSFDAAAVMAARGRKMASRDWAPLFELSMARKDVRLMLETAADAPLGVLPALADRMDALIADGEGEQDLAVLARDAGRHAAPRG